jgi:hypothetical protein
MGGNALWYDRDNKSFQPFVPVIKKGITMTIQSKDANEKGAVEELTDAQREFARVLGRLLAQCWQEEQSVRIPIPNDDENGQGATQS